jgi:ATP-dependent Clp protease protease subunit
MYIIENGRNISLEAKLLEENIVCIEGAIRPATANHVIKQLLFLDSKKSKSPVVININSPGGCVVSGLAILDTIQLMKRETMTVAYGLAASMGAVLLACGAKKGNRHITKNAQVMIHEVSSGTSGRASQMEVSFRQTQKLNKRLHELLADATGQDVKKLKRDMEKDVWLEKEAVLQYGLADKIMGE